MRTVVVGSKPKKRPLANRAYAVLLESTALQEFRTRLDHCNQLVVNAQVVQSP